MSSWIRSVMGDIRVYETPGHVLINGLKSAKYFLMEMGKSMGTIRFTTGMISDIRMTSFKVSRFFIYDFYEILHKVKNDPGFRYNKSIVNTMISRLKELEFIASIDKKYPSKLDYKQLDRFPFEPLPHQSEFFSHYDQKTQQYMLNGYILASAPGTGKTYSSLMLMAMLRKDVTIVFSPNNALEQVWRSTISSIQGAQAWVYPSKMEPDKDYTHYVFSHENTKYAKEMLSNVLAKAKGKSIGVILDECHRFTELVAQQTNNVIDICKATKSKDIIFMSGTPFKAMGKEMLPFLMATDPFFTEKDMIGFRKIFGASGNSALEILSSRIGRTMYVISGDTIIKNDVTTYTVKVKVPGGEKYTLPAIKVLMEKFISDRYEYYKTEGPRQVKEYLRILDQYKRDLTSAEDIKQFNIYVKTAKDVRDSGNVMQYSEEIKYCNKYEKDKIIPTLSPSDKAIFKSAKSVYKYLNLKIQGEALGQVLVAQRALCNVDIMRNLDNGSIFSPDKQLLNAPWKLDDIFVTSNSKVVMFTDFIEVLKEAQVVLKSKGYEPALVYGDTNKDLSDILKKVENDPNINPIVATYKSLSTAVPLIICDTVVLLNMPFRSYIYEQTTARVNRLGQKHPVHIYEYQLDTGDIPNISTRSKDIMEWSKKMVRELMGLDNDYPPEEDEDIEQISSIINKDTRPLYAKW